MSALLGHQASAAAELAGGVSNLLILTCARSRSEDPWQYIKAILPRVDAEQAPIRKGIVCDGKYEGPRPPGWDVYEFERPVDGLTKGNKLPYWHLLRTGLELGGDLVALEDDLIFCKNAVRRMATYLVPSDLAWVQFFSPRCFPVGDSYPGLWRPPPESSLFLQAAKYSRAGLEQLVAWAEDPEFICYQESDVALQLAAGRLKLDYGAHCPDLVQHVGEVSEASGISTLEKWRTAVCWPGEAFDAMKLYQRDDLYR